MEMIQFFLQFTYQVIRTMTVTECYCCHAIYCHDDLYNRIRTHVGNFCKTRLIKKYVNASTYRYNCSLKAG